MRDVSEEILSLFVAIRFQGSSTKPCPYEKPIDQGGTLYRLCGRADSESNFRTREKSLRQHRTIRQEDSARIFAPIQSLKNGGILYVFPIFQTEEVGQKDG